MEHATDATHDYSVLVVDDEPIVHQMIARILSEADLPLDLVGTASSGPEALELAGRLLPDICLLDIHMAEMNGFELAERLAEIPDYSPAIVYITAYRKFDYAQRAIRLGAADYLVKPIRREDVVETLGKIVRQMQIERVEQLEKRQIKKCLESVLPGIVPAAEPSAETRQEAVARVAREYIDGHYGESLSLSTVADHLNLSSGYFGSLFRSVCGMSFRAYLRRVRIARAKELMQDQRLNLTEVARMVGYDDIGYFSQSFLEETGMRPSEYRGEGRRWPK